MGGEGEWGGWSNFCNFIPTLFPSVEHTWAFLTMCQGFHFHTYFPKIMSVETRQIIRLFVQLCACVCFGLHKCLASAYAHRPSDSIREVARKTFFFTSYSYSGERYGNGNISFLGSRGRGRKQTAFFKASSQTLPRTHTPIQKVWKKPFSLLAICSEGLSRVFPCCHCCWRKVIAAAFAVVVALAAAATTFVVLNVGATAVF